MIPSPPHALPRDRSALEHPSHIVAPQPILPPVLMPPATVHPTTLPPTRLSPPPRAPAQRGHRLLALLAQARAQNPKHPPLTPPQTEIPRDLDVQIQGIRNFIARLECEIATRHGMRAERALTLRAQRRHVEELEAELSEITPRLSGPCWIELVERYNASKTHLGHLSDLDKRQTALDLSDDPHMEAELQKWRARFEQVKARLAAKPGRLTMLETGPQMTGPLVAANAQPFRRIA